MDETENTQPNGSQKSEVLLETDQIETSELEAENAISRRNRRQYPAQSFEEALQLAHAIQQQAGGRKVSRLTLFDSLGKSPDSSTSRDWISSAFKYGLIKGNYKSEVLELTEEGKIASGDEYTEFERTQIRVNLAILRITPFKALYDELAGTKRFPARQFLIDIAKSIVPEAQVKEALDLFIVNAQFVGLLRVLSGAERLVTLEYLLEQLTNKKAEPKPDDNSNIEDNDEYDGEEIIIPTTQAVSPVKSLLDDVCFYVSPIGEPGSEQRLHADLFMDHIIRPALDGTGLKIIRADTIESSGIITSQIIRHLLLSKLVVADLSFHNPNVFYELAIRHASRLPTVHIIRTSDTIPFDVNQMRTVKIDASSIYTLIPRLETYKTEIAVQVRRALEGDESAANPISIFFPSFRVTIDS